MRARIARLLGLLACWLGQHEYDHTPLGGPSKRHCLRDDRHGNPCSGWRYFGAFL